MAHRVGIDIGGTFTDFALFDPDAGRMAVHKQLTTPADPSVAVLEGIETLLARSEVALGHVELVAHGTTLVTNAVIERKGAVTGMLVTRGFRDILDMGLEQRYDLFDLRLVFPAPLVPRRLRHEVAERMRYDGEVETPLDLNSARRAARALAEAEEGVVALAICFLHSYANPAHELRVKEMLADEFPDFRVSISSEIFANMREYERWTTTTMNAYTQPMFEHYLARLEAGLAARGFDGRLAIMTSSGNSLAPDAARRFPVRALESGPAAGALMSAHHGRILGLPNLLSFDMGGTTAKGALIKAGVPLKIYDMEIARVHEFKRGSGLPVKIPAIDMIEIGAGGGSIAEVDERGVIRVGPRSAGADPGPACYGRGGERATLTDANLLLGYLDPAFFLGGAFALESARAEAVLEVDVAGVLELDLARAAWGVHEVINEDVARAFRIHASERGFDYRGSSMVAFGGSGPVHALAIARKLRIPRVVFPIGAGVMSALGLLVSPLGFEIARSRRLFVEDLDGARFAEVFEPLEAEARGFLDRAGVPRNAVTVIRRLDMRYQGQGYEIEVSLPEGLELSQAFARLDELFRARYAEVFAETFLEEPLEIVTWKVEAKGPEADLEGAHRLEGTGEAVSGGLEGARKGTRRGYFGDGFLDCAVYDRYRLAPGAEVVGPALVEERESTCVIGPGEGARVDARLNLIAELAHAT